MFDTFLGAQCFVWSGHCIGGPNANLNVIWTCIWRQPTVEVLSGQTISVKIQTLLFTLQFYGLHNCVLVWGAKRKPYKKTRGFQWCSAKLHWFYTNVGCSCAIWITRQGSFWEDVVKYWGIGRRLIGNFRSFQHTVEKNQTFKNHIFYPQNISNIFYP